jgi:hypothetical protein
MFPRSNCVKLCGFANDIFSCTRHGFFQEKNVKQNLQALRDVKQTDAVIKIRVKRDFWTQNII